MPSFTDDGDDMKALRAHCLQIEAIRRVNKSSDFMSGHNMSFTDQEPLTETARGDADFWELQACLFKIHFDRNGKKDEAMFGTTASPSQQQMGTKTPTKQALQVPRRLRFSMLGLDITPDTVSRCALPQQNQRSESAKARAAAVTATEPQLDRAYKEYERAYADNLMELEHGPSCPCNRHPWQHELHPSGTVDKNIERRQQRQRSEDAEMVERDEAEAWEEV